MEEWRRSNICPDYEVNNYGTVRNIKTQKTIYPTTRGGSNLYVGLRVNGMFKYYKLDEIVADAFCDGVGHSDMKVVHKNDNRYDNRPENLEYIPKQKHKTKRISYSDTKIRCLENLIVYHNLYECEADLGIKVKVLAECIRNGSMAVETEDGDIYNFELIDI